LIELASLPALNATLNGTAAVLLLIGRGQIRRREIDAHRRTMLAAFLVSTLFLTSYLIYHFNVGSVPFQGQGLVRPVYFALLLSHIVLAAVQLPMVLTTLILGLRRRDATHRRWARWTYPIWLYVSITGVVIYLMLYHLFAR
jgi:putative membrane protein